MVDLHSTLFVSINPRDYSRTATILNSNEFSQVKFHQITPKIKSIIKFSKQVRQAGIKTIVVASPSHILVPFIHVLTKARIVLDAGWPLSDSNFTRGRNSKFIILAFKNRIIDFLAFKMANIVFLESHLQKNKCSDKYSRESKKFHVSYTGVDETKYVNLQIDEDYFKSLMLPIGNKTIFFRAKINQEAGYEFLGQVSYFLPENISLIICTGGQHINYEFAKNTIILSTWLSAIQLRTLYLKSDLVLGQLSYHQRLSRTIPHKFYEAAYFGKALVTFENLGLLELVDQSEVIFLKSSTPEYFAKSIELLFESPAELSNYGNYLLQKQIKLFSQEKIAKNFLEIISAHGGVGY